MELSVEILHGFSSHGDLFISGVFSRILLPIDSIIWGTPTIFDNFEIRVLETHMRFGGTHLVGQKYVSARKNMRNELFSNYQKFKKIQDVKISTFENLDF